MIKLKGIPASAGVAIGKAYCMGKDEFPIVKRKVAYEDISREIYRLEEALIETRKEIVSLQRRISKDLGFTEAKVFEAHLLVLEDRVLIEDIIQQIKNKRVNVEYAFYQSIKKYIDTLLKIDDEYLRERVADIEDIGKRVLRKLFKKEVSPLCQFKEKVIVVAHDLSPADTATFPKTNIKGFVTDIGGVTSHTAIIARSLSIPSVVGVKIAMQKIKTGDTVIVDGSEGFVIVNPTEKVVKNYQSKITAEKKAARVSVAVRAWKPVTPDGKEVVVSGNIEIPEELPLLEQFGAQGVGLYRTEYMFLGRKDLPLENEQYKAYLNVAKAVKPYSVIIRTIDIGGDKFLSQPEFPQEFTPFLGWRAIRFCLARPEFFKVQLRAILRASAEGNVKVMFPMISGIEELRSAKALIEECKQELRKEGKSFDEKIEVGAMIEVPSAALTADILAKECDFFSLGTNDLIQYSIAVDRVNEKVAYLYEPLHPGVLKLIKGVIEAAHNNNIWVGMCGEMAGETLIAFLLLGMGLDEFSMPPPRIPKIKEMIRKTKFSFAKEVAEKALTFPTSSGVADFLKSSLKAYLKDSYSKIIDT